MRFFRYLCTILVAFIFISSCEDKKHHAFGNLNLQFEYNPTVTLSENKEPSNLKNNPTQSHLSNPIEKTIDFNKDVIIEMKDQDFKLSSEKISSVILQDYSTARITINNGNPVSLNLATTTSYNRTLSVGAAQIKIELLSSGSVVLYESTKSVQVYEDQSTSVIFKSSDWTVQNQEISITDGGFGDEVNVGQSITFQWTNSHAARPVRVYLIQGNENNQIQTLNSSYIGSSYTHNTTGSSAANNLGFKVTSSINSEVSSSVCCFNLKAPNVAPTAKNISAETNEDSPKEIQFDGEDSNGDSLTYSILSQPSNGSLGSISNDKVIYTPGQDFYGTDTFTYQASDGTYNSNAATVTITIAPINDPPVVQNIETSIDENLYQEGRYAEISLLGSDVDGDNLTYKLESNPSNGNASISGNLLTYNANQDWNGTESFSYSANDGQDDSNVSSIVIHVNAVNDAPVTIDATAETDEDTAVEITLTGTDIDVGDQLNFSTVQSNNGTISYNGNIATYTPTANFNGTDTFTFKANDGTDDSNTSTVTITVASVNDAPVANDVTASMNENKIAGRYQPVTITLDATDVEGDDLTYSIVGTPSNGTLGSISDNQIIYTPSQDYNGEDTFTYKANDGTADSNTATVTVTINAVNDAPVTTDQTASTDEDTAVEITLAATDVENDNLTFTIVSDVSNGTTSLSGATVTYTPDSNWNGTDTFTFKANDGTDDSNTSTVTITVNPVNDAPVTRDIPQEQKLNTSAIVDLSTQTTDIDNDTLIFSIVSNVSNGTTSIDGSIVTYTPNANFTGIDSYTYKANDGTDDSNTSTVTITVLPPSAPVAYDISSSVDEDWTGHTIKIVGDNTGGSDADGDALTYIIVSLPSNGNIYNDLGGGIPDGDALAVGDILTSNNTIYNPTANYNGTDSFTFKVNDGLLDSNIATVTITVNPVNDAPITWDVATTIDENRVMQGRLVGITLVGDDVDGDDLTYSLVTNPENGTATISGSRLTYTANQDWNGVETFTYKANDGTVDSNTSTVTVTVNPVNDTPVVIGGAGQGNLSMKFDASLVESGNTNDGYIQFPANTFDFGGEWTISFWYKDGGVTSGVQRIFSRGYTERDPHEGSSGNAAFGIGFLNDGGYARNLEFHARETFGEAAYSSSTIDVSDGWQHYVIVRNNSSMDLYINSSLDGFNETFGVIADNDYQTTDFINRIGSGALTLDDNGLITGWIDDFVIWNNSLNTSQISSLYNNGNGGVDPSTVLDWVIVHYSFDGETISGNTISDQSGNGNHATFTNVQGALSASSDVPFGIGGCTDCAPDTTIVTEEDTAGSIDLSSLVSDVDGDTLTYSIVTDVTNGTTSLSGSIVTYTPAANYNGSDSFTWKVNDGTVDSAAGKVYITVNAVNDTPVTSNQTASTDEDTVVEITLSSTDAESDTVTYSIVSDASNGSTSLSGSTVTYNPDENYNGTDSFTFKGNDGTDDGNTSTVTITVNPVNDGGPTVENSRQLEYFELNTTSSFSLSAQDEDGDELTYYISEEPTSGTVTIDGSSVQYTPNTGLSTFDSFKWYASDGQYNTNEVTVRMRFKPQFTFENTFSNGRDDEKAFAIEKTSDGGAILVGYSKTLIFNNADIYVVKVDSNGNKEWSNTYDYMGGNDWGGDIKELSSGNYLIAGSVNANSSGSSGDLYLLTINSIGEKVSDVIPFKVGFDNSIAYVDTPQNMFNGIENFRGNIDLDVAQDGNYIVSTRGGTHMFNSSTGQMIWEFNHALSGGAIQNSDGTIADLQFYSNPILTGLNQDGETLWSTSLGSSNTEYTWSLEATNDNGYIVTGWTTNLGAYLKDVYLTKINSSGSIVWNKAFYFDIEETTYGNLNDVGYKAIQLDSDNYLISAGDYLYKSDDTSNNGQESKIWERQLTSSYIYDLEELSSGVLFGAGYSIDGDMYLFRIDE